MLHLPCYPRQWRHKRLIAKKIRLKRVDRSTADDFLLLIVKVFRNLPGSALEMFNIMLQNSSQANYRHLDVV